MPEDFKKHVLSLESLGRAGLNERFEPAVEDIITNIRDVNTDAKKTRKLIIEVEITPDAERRNLVVAFDVKTVTSRAKKHAMPGFMGLDPDTRKPIIVAFDPQQGDVFRNATPGAEHGAGDTVSIESARRAREVTP